MESLNMVDCPNCNEKFNQVFLFPCLHNFCRNCTNLMKNGCDVTCSICSNSCHQDELKRNSFFEKIASIEPPNKRSKVEMSISSNKENLEKMKDKTIKCEICDPEETTMKASKYCTDCHQFMCEKCKKMHIRSKISSTHIIVNNINKGDSSSKESEILCKKHETILTLYCKDCDILICSTCHITNHSDHDTSDDFDEVSTQAITDIKNKISEIEDSMKNQNILMEENKLLESNWSQKCDAVSDDVENFAKELKDIIDKDTKINVEKINKTKIRFIKSIQRNFNEMVNYKSSLSNVKTYFQDVISNGSQMDVLNSMNVLNNYHLIEFDKPELIKNTELSFKKPLISRWISSELTKSLKFYETRDLKTIKLGIPTTSVCAFWQEKIFAVNENKKCIDIYDINTNNFTRSIDYSQCLRDNSNNICILNTQKDLFLYYQFNPHGRTSLLMLDNNNGTFFELRLFDVASRITATVQNTLIVRTSENFFIELSTTGSELKRIAIPGYTIDRCCASHSRYTGLNWSFYHMNIVHELNNGLYVVAQYINQSKNSVKVSLLGSADKSFCKDSSGDIITCTDGNKYLFVLESDLGRVTVFSTEMKPVHEFSHKDFKNMCYDLVNDKLILFNENTVFYFTYCFGGRFRV